MKLSESAERTYQARMEELSKDIWTVLEMPEYFLKIRGIHKCLVDDHYISARQAVRLFDFIYECEKDEHGNIKYYSKEGIKDAIQKIKRLGVYERDDDERCTISQVH